MTSARLRALASQGLSRRALLALGAWPWTAAAQPAQAVLRVAAGTALPTLAQAARVAQEGMTIEVVADDYAADVAVWTQDRLTLRAVGGRVRLHAQGAAAEGKAIWVVRAQQMRATGFDFIGCRVPHHNGAGIRLEAGTLAVHDCRFLDNQMGLMTANEAAIELEVHGCEFARNQRPDGHNHNLYAGRIARLTVTGCWSHSARTGHLLKSRAAHNLILANLLADGPDGAASYELEFPEGGQARVLGNLIQQSRHTQNLHMVSFGAEAWRGADHELLMAHNTFIDDTGQGTLLRAAPGRPAGRIVLANNVWVGSKRLDAPGAELHNNFTLSDADLDAGPVHHRRLRANSPAWGQAADRGEALRPAFEYRHERQTAPLTLPLRHPGALQ